MMDVEDAVVIERRAPPPPMHLLALAAPPRPPAPHELTVGTRLVAGLGWATVLPDIDFETYSDAGYVWNAAKGAWDGPPRSTQNKKGLPVIGAALYARHPSTEVLSCFYDLKDGLGKRHWRPGMPLPFDLFLWIARGGLLEAWNCMFELLIWRYVCERKYGWPPIPDRQWRDAMAKARASSYPGALGDSGMVMQLAIQKDKDGKRLLEKFSMPRKPTKADARWRIPTRETPYDDALMVAGGLKLPPGSAQADYEDTQKLYAYNARDIESEAEASSRCPDLEGEELEWWLEDQQINLRGVKIDRPGLLACIAVIEQCHEQYNAELLAITGIDSASKLEQIKGWLHARGVHLDTMDEEAIDEALKGRFPDDPPVGALVVPGTDLAAPATQYGLCRRVLWIRGAIGSAAVKKVFSMRNRLDEHDRLHDLFVYHGARTGRVTGDGPQPTNMPSGGPAVYRCAPDNAKAHEVFPCGRYFGATLTACPWCAMPVAPGKKKREWGPHAAEDALAVIATQDMRTVEHYFGDAMHAVSGCIRALYVADDDSDFVSSDYSSIEAVGLAMIAGEQWRIDVFRTHGRIYETSASRMYGVPFEEIMAVAGWTAEQLAQPEWWNGEPANPTGLHHPLRKKGKISELAFGYQGWIGAAKQFDMPGTDDEIKNDILGWWKASPSVEWLWGGQTLGKANGIRSNAGMLHGRVDRWDDTPFLFGCEGMVVAAIMTPGLWFPVLRLDGSDSGIAYFSTGTALYCRLPSGRHLTYHRPRLAQHTKPNKKGLAISYEGWNTNPKNGAKGWIAMDTWGGRLVENIVQATCRDILRFAVLNLRRAGYPTVLHVYDEIVAEVKKWFGSIEEFERIMAWVPEWAKTWPVKAAGGWRGRRYRKG